MEDLFEHLESLPAAKNAGERWLRKECKTKIWRHYKIPKLLHLDKPNKKCALVSWEKCLASEQKLFKFMQKHIGPLTEIASMIEKIMDKAIAMLEKAEGRNIFIYTDRASDWVTTLARAVEWMRLYDGFDNTDIYMARVGSIEKALAENGDEDVADPLEADLDLGS